MSSENLNELIDAVAKIAKVILSAVAENRKQAALSNGK